MRMTPNPSPALSAVPTTHDGESTTTSAVTGFVTGDITVTVAAGAADWTPQFRYWSPPAKLDDGRE